MHAWADGRAGKLKDAACGVLHALDDVAHAATCARGILAVILAEAGEVLGRLHILATPWHETCNVKVELHRKVQ